MEEKYEVVLFRPIKDLDLVNLLSNLFGREELGVRVRQIGERLNLPSRAEIVESSGLYSSMGEVDNCIKDFERTYRINYRL